MPNSAKDDQREISRRGFSEGGSSRVAGSLFFMKKNTPQNRGKTGKRRGSVPPVEHRFKPGQSGNPGGRPKKDIVSEIAQRVFEENADAIYRAMLKVLLKGDPEVFAVLADRAYGKLTRKVEIPGIENLPEALAEARARDG